MEAQPHRCASSAILSLSHLCIHTRTHTQIKRTTLLLPFLRYYDWFLSEKNRNKWSGGANDCRIFVALRESWFTIFSPEQIPLIGRGELNRARRVNTFKTRLRRRRSFLECLEQIIHSDSWIKHGAISGGWNGPALIPVRRQTDYRRTNFIQKGSVFAASDVRPWRGLGGAGAGAGAAHIIPLIGGLARNF